MSSCKKTFLDHELVGVGGYESQLLPSKLHAAVIPPSRIDQAMLLFVGERACHMVAEFEELDFRCDLCFAECTVVSIQQTAVCTHYFFVKDNYFFVMVCLLLFWSSGS